MEPSGLGDVAAFPPAVDYLTWLRPAAYPHVERIAATRSPANTKDIKLERGQCQVILGHLIIRSRRLLSSRQSSVHRCEQP